MNTKVAIIMGSHSDWETMKEAEIILKEFGVSIHKEIVSAHRSPELMLEFSKSAKEKGYSVIIAGAGGAAHLPGMVASMTTLPVLGVPIQSKTLNGLDSLLSIVQMPGGVPVGTLAIGTAGAKNAGLLAIRILALQDSVLSEKLERYRNRIREDALSKNKDLL
ncbi:5-(carboxyamino)imidazole ribonucleotide mutase [Leptospira noguchii]|uniref:N5-carboxyaminoimidazole ribonucleotide mutase n=1 Tax=Leptospira noguchii TaxID=28182 RepID=M6V810_9LEPT|nr:5-(carboxyamino)imidazole ribonucleotide mutase [Leptospira noguchii]EMO53537.1 phosphoribosylaminoimidazole carboxylase, catalytic subunit [Leptospira noguchii]